MIASVIWKDAMKFDGTVDNNTITMDAKAPLGKGSGATPKELLALGLGGCTAMDVIALLKKYKQIPRSFHIEIDVQNTSGSHPVVFEKATLRFVVDGEVAGAKLIEAVQLSQTKYCGVSAMLTRAFPIEYKIILNGSEIGSGIANFNHS